MKLLQDLTVPIIQGPMAGGASTPRLVAAVSEAGGIGSLAASLLSPDKIRAQAAQIRALTERPFILNLFVQSTPAPSELDIARATAALQPVLRRLGWDALPRPATWCEDFAAQFETVLALRPAAASFTFGMLDADHVARLHAAGIAAIGTVTTVEEALAWQAVGADAVIASGVEAGGHRGTFLGRQEDATLPARALWPAVAAAVDIPVIAAGGIMSGDDIRVALALGAQAVQMGTAFLVCEESGIHPTYRTRLIAETGTSAPTPTRLTRAFSGRYARGLENEYMRLMRDAESSLPAYPVMNALTSPIRAAAAERGDSELLSLWAGAGVGRARPMPVADLMAVLEQEWRGSPANGVERDETVG